LFAVAGHVTTANGQWAVTNLNGDSFFGTRAYASSGNVQYGAFDNFSGFQLPEASLWRGTADSLVSLQPDSSTGYRASVVYGASGSQQVGMVGRFFNTIPDPNAVPIPFAARWSGTASSFVVLHPNAPNATSSNAYATNGTQQVGAVVIQDRNRASLWSGTASSWIDLTPAVATEGSAVAISASRQGGWARVGGLQVASLWTGSAVSWINLHPAGASESRVTATSSTQQGGSITSPITFQQQAALWSGTAESFVNLHPDNASQSYINAMNESHQVGAVRIVGGDQHAAIWSGTANSWIDLHSLLPSRLFSSEATSISTDGVNIYVTGTAFGTDPNGFNFRSEAVVWTMPIPAPGVLAVLGFAGLVAAHRRRTK
jgi:hypothetical protein